VSSLLIGEVVLLHRLQAADAAHRAGGLELEVLRALVRRRLDRDVDVDAAAEVPKVEPKVEIGMLTCLSKSGPPKKFEPPSFSITPITVKS
jgi:hypothetical protein